MIVKPFYRGKTAQLSLVIQSSCTEFLLVGYKNLAWSKGTLSVNFLQAQVLTGPPNLISAVPKSLSVEVTESWESSFTVLCFM